MQYVVKWLASALIVFALCFLFGQSVQVDGFLSALWVALTLSVLNAIVRPLLVFLSIPITLVTFGLFLLVINALIVLLADKLLEGFAVSSFTAAFFFSLTLSVVNAIVFKQEK